MFCLWLVIVLAIYDYNNIPTVLFTVIDIIVLLPYYHIVIQMRLVVDYIIMMPIMLSESRSVYHMMLRQLPIIIYIIM